MPHPYRTAAAFLITCAVASPASPQSLYLGGAVAADVMVAGESGSSGVSIPAFGGNTISGAGRVGLIWNELAGVELEIAQAGETLQRFSIDTGGSAFPDFAIFPISVDYSRRHRVLTVSTVGSVRQRITDSTRLVYLGGVVFYRTTTQQTTTARLADTPGEINIVIPFHAKDVWYGTGPVVGVELQLASWEHVRLTPGVRLLGIGSSWLFRAGMGVAWAF